MCSIYKLIYRRLIHQLIDSPAVSIDEQNSVCQYCNCKYAGIGIRLRNSCTGDFYHPFFFFRYYLARKARQSAARGACCSLVETESRVPLSEVSFRTDGSRRCRTDFIRPRGVAESSFGCLCHGAVTWQRSIKTSAFLLVSWCKASSNTRRMFRKYID